jgi:hypothetical protein
MASWMDGAGATSQRTRARNASEEGSAEDARFLMERESFEVASCRVMIEGFDVVTAKYIYHQQAGSPCVRLSKGKRHPISL